MFARDSRGLDDAGRDGTPINPPTDQQNNDRLRRRLEWLSQADSMSENSEAMHSRQLLALIALQNMKK